jgi:hypothetical protein
MVPGEDIVSHSQYPWRVIPVKMRVSCTEKGCYVEVWGNYFSLLCWRLDIMSSEDP